LVYVNKERGKGKGDGDVLGPVKGGGSEEN